VNRRSILLRSLFIFLLLVGYVAGCATGSGQPHMQAALDHLRAARNELSSATSDKGGHRERAMSIVDQAVDEVQRGIDFARTH
jgi:hypothetical protein